MNSSWVNYYFQSNSAKGLMRRVLKQEGVEKDREEMHIKPRKVKKTSEEVKKPKLSYHKGWHVATIRVGARNISPQNTSLGPQKSVLRSRFAGVGGGNQQHPFSLTHPKYPPRKTTPGAAHFCERKATPSLPETRNPSFWGVCTWWRNSLRLPELFPPLDCSGSCSYPSAWVADSFFPLPSCRVVWNLQQFGIFETVSTLRNMTETGHLVEIHLKATEGTDRQKDSEIS